MLHLLDTNILIRVLRGQSKYLALLDKMMDADHILASCPITVTEIYAGMYEREEPKTRAFMDSLHFLAITPSIAERAGRLRATWIKKNRMLSLADAMVAAVVLENECILVTENLKDFPMPELQIYPL